MKCPGGIGRPGTHPVRVRADKAYALAGNRAHLRRRGIRAIVPEKKDHRANRLKKGSAGGRPPRVDHEDSRLRSAVERMFNRLKRRRAVATRHDKLAAHDEATVQIATMDHRVSAVA